MYAAGALLWAIVAGYVTFARLQRRVRLFGQTIELPGMRMAVLQVMLATVDVAITATIFYQLLPPVPHLTWVIFLGVYVASYTAGLAANLPGRHRRVRHRHAAGPAPLSRRPPHRRRHRRVPPLLLRHPAVPRRLPVRRQRDPAARRHAVAARRHTAASAGHRPLERAGLRRRHRHRLRGAVRRAAAVPRRAGAAARLLLDRSGRRRPCRSRRGSSCPR